MCMVHEQKQKVSWFARFQKPTVAYKVMRHFSLHDTFASPCIDVSKRYERGKLYKATPIDRELAKYYPNGRWSETGFYAFPNKEDAIIYRQAISRYDSDYVIVRVELKGVLATGKQPTSRGVMNGLRAKYMRIVEVVEA